MTVDDDDDDCDALLEVTRWLLLPTVWGSSSISWRCSRRDAVVGSLIRGSRRRRRLLVAVDELCDVVQWWCCTASTFTGSLLSLAGDEPQNRTPKHPSRLRRCRRQRVII